MPFVCPECQNDKHFVELNIVGYIANFDSRPDTTITGVSAYENIGIFCANCFDVGNYVQVGTEHDLLPPALIERALLKQRDRRIQGI